MTKSLLIVGAGYTGTRLAKLAVHSGYDVVGTSRSPERKAALLQVGATALGWTVGESLAPLTIDSQTTVVYSIPPTAGDHVDAVRPFLNSRCHRFVYLSSASVYGDGRGALIDEESPRRPTSAAGKMRRDVEDLVLATSGNNNVVRIVGIYGPDRTLDRYIAAGRYKLVDGGHKRTNRIHVDDLARTIMAVVERAPSGPRSYLAADGQPVPVVELVNWLVEHRGIERPDIVTLEQYRAERGHDAADRWANNYVASNRRIVAELGVNLAYPTVFDGYRAIFGT